MPPIGPRKTARKRAADAYRLRCMGRTWEEIAQATGFKNHASACNAVKAHIQRMPREDQTIARAYSAGNHRLVIAQLYEIASRARAAEELATAVRALQAAADVQERHDRLRGLHIAVPQQVDISVRSAGAVLERAEAELLAIAEAQPAGLPVIDAEVVEA